MLRDITQSDGFTLAWVSADYGVDALGRPDGREDHIGVITYLQTGPRTWRELVDRSEQLVGQRPRLLLDYGDTGNEFTEHIREESKVYLFGRRRFVRLDLETPLITVSEQL